MSSEDRTSLAEATRAAREAVMAAGGVAKINDGVTLPPNVTQYSPTQGLLEFDLPVESPTLPSQGLLYDKEPLKGAKTLDIKGITTYEENILVNQALIKKGTMLSHLISSCLIDKRINVADLVSGDKNALLVAIRAVGYGVDYSPEISCPACEKKQPFHIDLSKLPLKLLDLSKLNQVEEYKNEFYVQLPASKKNITFKFLTSGEEEAMLAEMEARRKKGIAEQPITQRMFAMIQSVEGRRDRSLIMKFVSNMLGMDSVFLRKYYDDHEPGIDMSSEFVCSGCGHTEVLTVPIGPTFLWPNARG
jgi:hypothetical protein